MIVLDYNEKLSINKVPELPSGVGTFTSTSSSDTKSFQFVTMNELKKAVPGGFNFFPFTW